MTNYPAIWCLLASERWIKREQSDLADLMHVTFAARYADNVAGERRHISFIQQPQRRLKRPAAKPAQKTQRPRRGYAPRRKMRIAADAAREYGGVLRYCVADPRGN